MEYIKKIGQNVGYMQKQFENYNSSGYNDSRYIENVNNKYQIAQRQQTYCLQKERINSKDIVNQQQMIEIQFKLNVKKHCANSLTINEKQQKLRYSSYLMEMINHYIYDIADRNQAYEANYAHFLVLLYLTIKQITILVYPSDSLINLMKFIYKKIQKEQIKKQLRQQIYYDFMALILRFKDGNLDVLHSFMRNFLIQQRNIAISVFPYYFNLFALVVNKEVIFNGQSEHNLIEYTIDFIHNSRFKGKFTRQDVFNQMRKVQSLSIKMYHSEQL